MHFAPAARSACASVSVSTPTPLFAPPYHRETRSTDAACARGAGSVLNRSGVVGRASFLFKIRAMRKLSTPAVIVGFETNGLGVARALRRESIPSISLAGPGWTPSCASWSTKITMSSGWNEDALVNDLIAIGRRLHARAPLLITKDEPVLWISANRAALGEYFEIVMPEHDTVLLLMDKLRFHSLATERGWPLPRSWLVNGRSELASILHDVTYPCILKPAVKNSEFRKKSPRKAFKAYDAPQLTEAYDLVSSWEPEVVVQEWIDGGDDRVAFGLGYWNARSQPLALFPGRKIRQWPPECGNTALSERAPAEWRDELATLTAKIYDAVGYRGLGSIEYKVSSAGRLVIMEPTVGRTNYQNEVAVLNGVNLPAIAYFDGMGMRPELERMIDRRARILARRSSSIRPRTIARRDSTSRSRDSRGEAGGDRGAAGSGTCSFDSATPPPPSCRPRGRSRRSSSIPFSNRCYVRSCDRADGRGIARRTHVSIGLRHPAPRDAQAAELVSLPLPHHTRHTVELLLVGVVEHEHAAGFHILHSLEQTLQPAPSIHHHQIPRRAIRHLANVLRHGRIIVVGDRDESQIPTQPRIRTERANLLLELLHPLGATLDGRDPASLFEKEERGSATAPLENPVRRLDDVAHEVNAGPRNPRKSLRGWPRGGDTIVRPARDVPGMTQHLPGHEQVLHKMGMTKRRDGHQRGLAHRPDHTARPDGAKQFLDHS